MYLWLVIKTIILTPRLIYRYRFSFNIIQVFTMICQLWFAHDSQTPGNNKETFLAILKPKLILKKCFLHTIHDISSVGSNLHIHNRYLLFYQCIVMIYVDFSNRELTQMKIHSKLCYTIGTSPCNSKSFHGIKVISLNFSDG